MSYCQLIEIFIELNSPPLGMGGPELNSKFDKFFLMSCNLDSMSYFFDEEVMDPNYYLTYHAMIRTISIYLVDAIFELN